MASPEALLYMIDHVFLPPKLPDCLDKDEVSKEGQLQAAICGSLEAQEQLFNLAELEASHAFRNAVWRFGRITDSRGSIIEASLLAAMQSLVEADDGILPIYVRAQNASIVMRRTEVSVAMDVMEISPPNAVIMGNNGRLRRHLPDTIANIPIETFENADFQNMLAYTIAKLSHQPLLDSQMQARKAGVQSVEMRDSTRPFAVTDLLATVLAAVETASRTEPSGASHSNPANINSRIWKHTRDEVLWASNASHENVAWRRSPIWLLLRFIMQSLAHRVGKPLFYKAAMLVFMAQVLTEATRNHVSSSLIHCMLAKISRRLRKIPAEQRPQWLTVVERASVAAHETIQGRWARIVMSCDPSIDTSALRALDFAADTSTIMTGLDDCLGSMDSDLPQARRAEYIAHSLTLTVNPMQIPSLRDGSYSANTSWAGLQRLELWVARCLGTYEQTHINTTTYCSDMYQLMLQYHRDALPQYSQNPENMSIMFLTCAELWISCDKSAVSRHEILRDYKHHIPTGFVESLILPLRNEMDRLAAAETYFLAREGAAKSGIFSVFGTQDCLAVRYFLSSPEHQQLMAEIKTHAKREREAKLVELKAAKVRYARLLEQSGALQHTRLEEDPSTCHSVCQRCKIESLAEEMEIDYYEWPLPAQPLEEQATVFELDVPHSISSWRDASLFFAVEILGHEYQHDQTFEPRYGPNDCLRRFIRSTSDRLRLRSVARPHRMTHYDCIKVSIATEDNVLKPNGLRYLYCDSKAKRRTSVFVDKERAAKFCTYVLPSEFNGLQDFLARPASKPDGLTANHVISTQSKAPDSLSSEEYRGLVGIPVGHRIGWRNILLQLRLPSVDLNKLETGLMLLQTSRQAGPSPITTLRESHKVLSQTSFTEALLESLELCLGRVRDNWESARVLSACILLATRLLSLSASLTIKERSLAYLRDCRNAVILWIRKTHDEAKRSSSNERRRYLQQRTFELSMICACTFDIDNDYLQSVLADPSQLAILVETSTITQESESTRGTQEGGRKCRSTSNDIAYQRWQRLMFRSCPILRREVIDRATVGLTTAITRIWVAFRPQQAWAPASGSSDHWLINKSAGQGGGSRSMVHYNLLTAELLVDGLPLSRLPSQYESHPSYETFFGGVAVDVMPTTELGMAFSVKSGYNGHLVYLGLKSAPNGQGTDLRIRTTKEGVRYDLIPHRLFSGLLPKHFVEAYVHWYDRTTQSIQFRLKTSPWEFDTHDWKLIKDGALWRLSKQSTLLLDINSHSATQIRNILGTLESRDYIHMIWESTQLRIDLPRLHLSFRLHGGSSKIRSKQYRGMYIDVDQRFGTLVGLFSKLVLRDDSGQNRMMLIPNGSPSWQVFASSQADHRENVDHIRVTITPGSSTKAVPYYLDRGLRRLVSDGSLQAMLSLSRLHALTSYCIPDDFTGTTGTEAALSLLRSGAVQSFSSLSEEDQSILSSIRGLAPRRRYHPTYQQTVQHVTWVKQLDFLSQSDEFHAEASSLLEKSKALEFLHGQASPIASLSKWTDERLVERSLRRSSVFRTWGSGGEHESKATLSDVRYKHREGKPNMMKVKQTHDCSRMVIQQTGARIADVSQRLVSDLYELLCCSQGIPGPGAVLDRDILLYDASLVDDPLPLLQTYWCRLNRLLGTTASAEDIFFKSMFFASLCFSGKIPWDAIQVLVAVINVPAIRQIQPPAVDHFDLKVGYVLKLTDISSCISSAVKSFADSNEYSLVALENEPWEVFDARRRRSFRDNAERAVAQMTEDLARQEGVRQPTQPDPTSTYFEYINGDTAMAAIRTLFRKYFENNLMRIYLGQLATGLQSLNQIRYTWAGLESGAPLEPPAPLARLSVNISDQGLFDDRGPSVFRCQTTALDGLVGDVSLDVSDSDDLRTMVHRFQDQVEKPHDIRYATELEDSVDSLQTRQSRTFLRIPGNELQEALVENLKDCLEILCRIDRSIVTAVKKRCAPPGSYFSATDFLDTYMMPRICPALILRQLRRVNWQRLSSRWQGAIVEYAIALTQVQRAERLVSLQGKEKDLLKEFANPGHRNWSPRDYPESLLIEVESSIIIRETQEDIAAQMRAPAQNQNSVMQLNMGEGKSSVIVPIVAAHLADGTRLIRVVVAKPQSKQMFQMLVSKLGGLCDHRIYQLPFSRSLRLSVNEMGTIYDTITDCKKRGGVLLIQPEHLISFQLMGIENVLTGSESTGRDLLKCQHFLNQNTRDIVDESDQIFSTKFELIYTIGSQQAPDLAPDRWRIIQMALALAGEVSGQVAIEMPAAVESARVCQGSFPRTRLLETAAQKRFVALFGARVCATGLPGLPIGRQPRRICRALFVYMTEPDLSEEQAAEVELDSTFWTEATAKPLLLMRGLLAGGIFAFVFGQKRWRVNYGLDDTRQPSTRLAVPYRAKDSPSARSEFSHPDVVIILTCISYYYGGLDDRALELAFDNLFKHRQAEAEYRNWVEDAPSLDARYRTLAGVNLKDIALCKSAIFPHLRRAKRAVDYYLCHLVFPKEMKEFPFKLSASGWDLGKKKPHATTGFSGTADSQHLLPLAMKHMDLESQRHTNALVLQYLLQPENTVEMMLQDGDANVGDATRILNLVTSLEPEVQVVIDVGAQVLELGNLEFAKAWLTRVSVIREKSAALYFNDNDELCVVDTSGLSELLQTSPYAKQLDQCVLFLDEAHTRGTDIKLPEYYRAAVTLGPNVTKDKLVQACMRLRKLGHGQSVVFCVSPEIETKIVRANDLTADESIKVSDVLIWAMHETSLDLQRSMPLWAVQGTRFERQRLLWDRASSEASINLTQGGAEEFLEDEARDLYERYAPSAGTLSSNSATPIVDTPDVRRIREKLADTIGVTATTATLQEEQERELSPEVEEERQIERSRPAEPAQHSLSKSLINLVTLGVVAIGEYQGNADVFIPAFSTLCDITPAKDFDVAQFPRFLLVTRDFARTVQRSPTDRMDSFQRPVQWILTLCRDNHVDMVLVISPFEANALLPEMHRATRGLHMHIYAPRNSLAYEPLDDLKLYPEPPLPEGWTLPLDFVVCLNLFAGQLYFSSYREYVRACELLGLACRPVGENETLEADGFVAQMGARRGITKSPVPFLKTYLTKIRRDCETIDKTHWGRVLDGEVLTEQELDRRVGFDVVVR